MSNVSFALKDTLQRISKSQFFCLTVCILIILCKFAYMNNNLAGTAKWCENVMVVDADYIDKVAFDLIVNFEG